MRYYSSKGVFIDKAWFEDQASIALIQVLTKFDPERAPLFKHYFWRPFLNTQLRLTARTCIRGSKVTPNHRKDRLKDGNEVGLVDHVYGRRPIG